MCVAIRVIRGLLYEKRRFDTPSAVLIWNGAKPGRNVSSRLFAIPLSGVVLSSNNGRLARGVDVLVGIRGVAPTVFAFVFAAAHY